MTGTALLVMDVRGIAAELLRACEPEARRLGARKLSLRALSTNEPA